MKARLIGRAVTAVVATAVFAGVSGVGTAFADDVNVPIVGDNVQTSPLPPTVNTPGGDPLEDAVALIHVEMSIVNPVDDTVTTRAFDMEPGGTYRYTPGDIAFEAGLIDGLDATKRCTPGGWDVYGTLTAKNFHNGTLWKFHDDFRFWYNCKIIQSIPFNKVYGSDYSYAWEWDGLLTNSRQGAGTKFGIVEGSAKMAQRMCFFGGCQTLNSATPSVRYNIDHLGNIDVTWSS